MAFFFKKFHHSGELLIRFRLIPSCSIIYTSLLIMSLVLNTSLWILSSLIALTTAHPSCSLIYGRANGDDCQRLLVGFTRFDPGLYVRIFVLAALEQPANVNSVQWSARVNFPSSGIQMKMGSYTLLDCCDLSVT